MVGGATRNSFWMQNKADVTGLPIDVPGSGGSHASWAQPSWPVLGLGYIENEQDAFEQVYKPGKTYQPDPKLAPKYAEWYQIYKQLYPVLKPVSHQLYDQFRV